MLPERAIVNGTEKIKGQPFRIQVKNVKCIKCSSRSTLTLTRNALRIVCVNAAKSLEGFELLMRNPWWLKCLKMVWHCKNNMSILCLLINVYWLIIIYWQVKMKKRMIKPSSSSH